MWEYIGPSAIAFFENTSLRDGYYSDGCHLTTLALGLELIHALRRCAHGKKIRHQAWSDVNQYGYFGNVLKRYTKIGSCIQICFQNKASP